MNEKEIWEKVYSTPIDKIPWNLTQFDWFKELVDNNEIVGKTALDLGCGIGTKSIYLAEHSDFEKIIGIDISEKAIENTKKNDKCIFIVHDVCDLNFLDEEKFDFILDWANLHDIPEEKREQYIEQINNHSKIGTLFLLRVFSKKNQETDSFINPNGIGVNMFSKKDLINLFPNFEIKKENESKPWGERHKDKFFIELLMRRIK